MTDSAYRLITQRDIDALRVALGNGRKSDLARQLGVDRRTVGRWLSGEIKRVRPGTMARVRKIAKGAKRVKHPKKVKAKGSKGPVNPPRYPCPCGKGDMSLDESGEHPRLWHDCGGPRGGVLFDIDLQAYLKHYAVPEPPERRGDYE